MRKGSNATLNGLVGWVREAVCQGWQGAKRSAMLSDLELRGIIEGSFLPKRCEVTKASDASLTVKVYHEIDHDRVDLVVTGICANKLDSSRAI
eukprot:gene18766-22353_t